MLHLQHIPVDKMTNYQGDLYWQYLGVFHGYFNVRGEDRKTQFLEKHSHAMLGVMNCARHNPQRVVVPLCRCVLPDISLYNMTDSFRDPLGDCVFDYPKIYWEFIGICNLEDAIEFENKHKHAISSVRRCLYHSITQPCAK